MARIERHRAYREQIKNDGKLKHALNETSPLIRDFKKQLDSINPKILVHYKPVDIQLLNLLTIDSSKRTNINAIQAFVNEFNFSELISLREKAELMIISSQKTKNSQFEEGWLNNDLGLQMLNRCNNMFNDVQRRNINFDQASQEDFKRFKEIEYIARRAKSNGKMLEKFDVQKTPHSKSTFIPYFSALITLGVVLLAFIVIFLVLVFI